MVIQGCMTQRRLMAISPLLCVVIVPEYLEKCYENTLETSINGGTFGTRVDDLSRHLRQVRMLSSDLLLKPDPIRAQRHLRQSFLTAAHATKILVHQQGLPGVAPRMRVPKLSICYICPRNRFSLVSDVASPYHSSMAVSETISPAKASEVKVDILDVSHFCPSHSEHQSELVVLGVWRGARL